MNHQDTKTPREPVSDRVDQIASAIVDAAYNVHSSLGPGLLENVYEVCLIHALHKRGLSVQRQMTVPVIYDGVRLATGFRLDLLVEGCVVVELKAVDALTPVYMAQVLTYLKLTGHRLGLLINFNVPLIKDGIKRIIL